MPTISISTREDSNNRSMVQPPARTESGLTLRPISLGSLEILRQLGNPLASGEAELSNIDTKTLYLIIWQRMQPTDTELACIGVSTNAVTPSIGGSARWEFDRLELNGEDIRICFSTDPSTNWEATHTFGGRALSCSGGASDGCRINASNGASNYLVEMHMDFIVEALRFTPGTHQQDSSLHLSEDEHAGLAQLLARKDELLALLSYPIPPIDYVRKETK